MYWCLLSNVCVNSLLLDLSEHKHYSLCKHTHVYGYMFGYVYIYLLPTSQGDSGELLCTLLLCKPTSCYMIDVCLSMFCAPFSPLNPCSTGLSVLSEVELQQMCDEMASKFSRLSEELLTNLQQRDVLAGEMEAKNRCVRKHHPSNAWQFLGGSKGGNSLP